MQRNKGCYGYEKVSEELGSLKAGIKRFVLGTAAMIILLQCKGSSEHLL